MGLLSKCWPRHIFVKFKELPKASRKKAYFLQVVVSVSEGKKTKKVSLWNLHPGQLPGWPIHLSIHSSLHPSIAPSISIHQIYHLRLIRGQVAGHVLELFLEHIQFSAFSTQGSQPGHAKRTSKRRIPNLQAKSHICNAVYLSCLSSLWNQARREETGTCVLRDMRWPFLWSVNVKQRPFLMKKQLELLTAHTGEVSPQDFLPERVYFNSNHRIVLNLNKKVCCLNPWRISCRKPWITYCYIYTPTIALITSIHHYLYYIFQREKPSLKGINTVWIILPCWPIKKT